MIIRYSALIPGMIIRMLSPGDAIKLLYVISTQKSGVMYYYKNEMHFAFRHPREGDARFGRGYIVFDPNTMPTYK